jgi:hypothetical protein
MFSCPAQPPDGIAERTPIEAPHEARQNRAVLGFPVVLTNSNDAPERVPRRYPVTLFRVIQGAGPAPSSEYADPEPPMRTTTAGFRAF